MFSIAYLPVKTNATYEWSDDFNDGNYDGWTVDSGAFTCANLYLETTEVPSSLVSANIIHQNNISTGTWSFDFHVPPSADHINIKFGNGIRLALSDSTFGVYRGSYDNILFSYKPSQNVAGTWTHLDITIDEISNISMFVNNSHVEHYTTLPISGSGDFRVISWNVGDGLDNIVVNDAIDYEALPFNESYIPTTTTTTEPETTTTTEPTTSTTPTEPTEIAFPIELLAVGAVVIVIIIIVAFKVKQS
jgi:hypothetical protein